MNFSVVEKGRDVILSDHLTLMNQYLNSVLLTVLCSFPQGASAYFSIYFL